MSIITKPFALFIGLILVAGCTTLQRGEKEQQVYQLLAPDAPRSNPARLEADLIIPRLTVQPGYGTSAMAYRKSNFELRYYTRSRWSEPPLRMLQPALITGLGAQGPFRFVITGQSSLPAEYRLNVDLIRLEQDFRTSPSQLVLEVKIELVDEADRRLKLSDTIRIRRTAPSEDAEGGVIAANAALEDLITEIAQALRAALE